MGRIKPARASKENKLSIIRKFVLQQRNARGIKRLPGPQPEVGCEAVGEFNNIIWRALMFTPESEWLSNGQCCLSDPQTLNGVYRTVLRLRELHKRAGRGERGLTTLELTGGIYLS